MTTPLQIRTKFDILPREGVRIFHFVCQRIFCVSLLAVQCFLIYLSCASSHIILDLIVRRGLCIHWTADNVLFFSFYLIECINVNTTTHHTSAKQLLYISKWILFFSCCFWTWCLNVDTWSKAKCQATACRAIFSVQTNRCGSNVFNACLLNWKRYCLLSSCVIFWLFVTIHCPYEIKYDNFFWLCWGVYFLNNIWSRKRSFGTSSIHNIVIDPLFTVRNELDNIDMVEWFSFLQISDIGYQFLFRACW